MRFRVWFPAIVKARQLASLESLSVQRSALLRSGDC